MLLFLKYALQTYPVSVNNEVIVYENKLKTSMIYDRHSTAEKKRKGTGSQNFFFLVTAYMYLKSAIRSVTLAALD